MSFAFKESFSPSPFTDQDLNPSLLIRARSLPMPKLPIAYLLLLLNAPVKSVKKFLVRSFRYTHGVIQPSSDISQLSDEAIYEGTEVNLFGGYGSGCLIKASFTHPSTRKLVSKIYFCKTSVDLPNEKISWFISKISNSSCSDSSDMNFANIDL